MEWQGGLGRARAVLARVSAPFWLAAVAAAFLWRAEPSALDAAAYNEPWEGAIGVSLVHGLRGLANADPGAVSCSMPLQAVISELTFNHAPPLVVRSLPLLLWLAALGLTFALGQGLHSGLCGGLAALAAAPLLEQRFNYVSVYTLLVLLTANLLVRRAESPDLRRSLMLAAAMGLSLLERSALFLFGPLLALGDAVRQRSYRARSALILFFVPFVFLLPWLGMNWSLHREIVPFEKGRADVNIAAGALGLVSMVEGDLPLLTGAGHGNSVLAWAAMEIASHPGRYLYAVAARIWLLFLIHPMLFACSILAAWLWRGAPAYLQLSLLAAYYVGVHCLMAIKPAYFIPLWPILAALAASLPAEIMGGRRPVDEARFFTGAVLTAFWVAFGLGAFTLYRVSLYPRPAATIDAAIAANPADAGLRAQRARLRLSEGRPADAIRDLRQALLLRPDPEAGLDYAWAQLARGGAASDTIYRIRLLPDDPGHLQRKAGQLRMLAGLQRGRNREAAAALSRAETVWEQQYVLQLGNAPRDRTMQDWLMLHDQSLRKQFCDLIEGWPGPRRFQLAAGWERIARRAPGEYRAQPLCGRDRTAGWWLESEGYAQVGARAQELRALAREQRLRPSAGVLLEPALACQRSGDYGRALGLLDRLARELPQEAQVLNARGVVRALRGENGEAVRDLRAAIALDRFLLDSYLSLGVVYALAGQAAEARRVYDEALRLDPMLVDPKLRRMIRVERGSLR